MDLVQHIYVLSAHANKSRGEMWTWVNKEAALLDRELKKLDRLF